MNLLDAKLAVVTGATRGIGLAVARALQSAGARVVRVARRFPDDPSSRWSDIPCDITSDSVVHAAVERIVTEHGTPDMLVNNAGAFVMKPLDETTSAEFQRQLATNVLGPFHVTRALLPHFLARGGGHVVTIGSIADHVPLPGNAAYGASKYGLRGLHEIMAAELAGSGVRLTLVSPGPTDTPLWDPLRPDERDDLPGRAQMQTAQDVADVVVFVVTRGPTTNIELVRMMPT